MTKFEKWVRDTYVNVPYLKRHRIVCKDGFSMSVNGSTLHDSIPAKPAKKYFAMEVAHPSETESELAYFYARTGRASVEGNYPKVPVYVIERIIQKHGGLDLDKIENTPIKY